jgi:hypothetical protein
MYTAQGVSGDVDDSFDDPELERRMTALLVELRPLLANLHHD